MSLSFNSVITSKTLVTYLIENINTCKQTNLDVDYLLFIHVCKTNKCDANYLCYIYI